MSHEQAAQSFLNVFRRIYREQMIAAALSDDSDAPMRTMNRARDCLAEKIDCDKSTASNLVRAIHVAMCREIGHVVPESYRVALIQHFEQNIL